MVPVDSLPLAGGSSSFTLLDGVRILDLTTSIAAPYATMLLSDLGAEVIKIERPGTGDDSRAWGPPFLNGQSLWYLSVNRNKASVTLDYSTDAGREILYRLVAQCDMVMLNLVPRVQRKLKVDEATLRAINDRLIFVSVTGFGLKGERADNTAYDIIAEGYSGVMDITGEADSPPQKIGTPAADLLSGMDAVMMAIAALYERERTGKGRTIDIAMVESMTRFLTPRIVTYLGSGELPRRTGARDSVIAIYQAFETADDPLTLGLGNDGLWRRFWDALGQPEIGLDPRFATNADRHAHRAGIVDQIQAIFRTRPRAHWLDLMQRAKVPCGPINRVDEIAADPQLQERGFLFGVDNGDFTVPQVGLGIRVDDQPSWPRSPPPALGADTRDVLGRIAGLDDAALDALRRDGVI